MKTRTSIWFAALSLVVIVSTTLVACARPAPTAAPTSAPAAAQPTQPPAPTTAPAPTAVPPTAVPSTAAPTTAPPTQAPSATPLLSADAIRGGRLYDNWMKELGADVPEGNAPLWATQSTNTRTGADTWRCKECHGWDYKGAEGAYGSGSHRTGFKGILGASGMAAEELTAWLDGGKNPDHDFKAHLTAEAMNQMVSFMQSGLVDMSAFILADKTVASGNLAHGKTLWEGTCQACHGENGKTLNFGDDASPEFVGTIAVDNPWEFFHKASMGQPGVPTMRSALDLGWTPQDIIDVLTYAQTLPIE